jgi:DNA-binding response OmpR family regulator
MNIGLRDKRKTILLIDADPHARAILRKALEAASFSVGEAANSHEGQRTIEKVKPDAVLTDLLVEPSGAGVTVSEWLRAKGDTTPCYIVSTAADALTGSVGLHELGVTGVFLKPVDPAVVIQTLRTQLGVGQPQGTDA